MNPNEPTYLHLLAWNETFTNKFHVPRGESIFWFCFSLRATAWHEPKKKNEYFLWRCTWCILFVNNSWIWWKVSFKENHRFGILRKIKENDQEQEVKWNFQRWKKRQTDVSARRHDSGACIPPETPMYFTSMLLCSARAYTFQVNCTSNRAMNQRKTCDFFLPFFGCTKLAIFISSSCNERTHGKLRTHNTSDEHDMSSWVILLMNISFWFQRIRFHYSFRFIKIKSFQDTKWSEHPTLFGHYLCTLHVLRTACESNFHFYKRWNGNAKRKSCDYAPNSEASDSYSECWKPFGDMIILFAELRTPRPGVRVISIISFMIYCCF